MKLKKIASLALAGIMAVSMLAGCATTNDNGDDGNNGKPPVIDETPTSYSQTILDGVSSDVKSMMTAKDSDMLTDAVVAAGTFVNESDDIHNLIKYAKRELTQMYYTRYGYQGVVRAVVDGFGDNLAEDVDLYNNTAFDVPTDANDRYAALYVCDTSMNETQLNNAISAAVKEAMKGNRDHINATDIDYTLSVAKAQVGTAANGITLVGIMVEVDRTDAA